MSQKLSIITDVIRNLKNLVTGLRLMLKFNDANVEIIARDGSGYGYDSNYIGGRAYDEVWTGESAILDGDCFEVPAAPFNFVGDFTLACWVKTNSTDYAIFSGARNGETALEVTNKRVTINGVSYTYAV